MSYEYLKKACGGAINPDTLIEFQAAMREYEEFMSGARKLFGVSIVENFPEPPALARSFPHASPEKETIYISEVVNTLQEPAPRPAPVWERITEERYNDMLGQLPPAVQTSFGFLVGEPTSFRVCKWSGLERPTYGAFIQDSRGHYYGCRESLTVAEFRQVLPNSIVFHMSAGESISAYADTAE